MAPHAPASPTSFLSARSAAGSSATSAGARRAAGFGFGKGTGETANLDMGSNPYQAALDLDLAAMDLLSTESCAWLRADEDAGLSRPAADTPRGAGA